MDTHEPQRGGISEDASDRREAVHALARLSGLLIAFIGVGLCLALFFGVAGVLLGDEGGEQRVAHLERVLLGDVPASVHFATVDGLPVELDLRRPLTVVVALALLGILARLALGLVAAGRALAVPVESPRRLLRELSEKLRQGDR